MKQKKDNEDKIYIENKISTPFTWIENNLIRSKKITYEGLGLYLTLRSFGHGIAYPSIATLCLWGRCGKDKLYRILAELIKLKLIIRRQKQKENGLFSKVEYRILSPSEDYFQAFSEFTNQQNLDNRQSQPYREKPHTVKPDTENPPLIRINNKSKKNNNNIKTWGKKDTAPQTGYLANLKQYNLKISESEKATRKIIDSMPESEIANNINRIIQTKKLDKIELDFEVQKFMALKYLATEIMTQNNKKNSAVTEVFNIGFDEKTTKLRENNIRKELAFYRKYYEYDK